MEPIVNQTDMVPDNDVTVVPRTGRQPLEKFLGDGTDAMAHVAIENDANLKSGFQPRWQPVTVAKARWEMAVALGVPTSGGLAIAVLEARTIVVSVAISVVILGKGAAANARQSESEKGYRTSKKQVT
jgi:hypothetical protein